jgi:hypothetical protein
MSSTMSRARSFRHSAARGEAGTGRGLAEAKTQSPSRAISSPYSNRSAARAICCRSSTKASRRSSGCCPTRQAAAQVRKQDKEAAGRFKSLSRDVQSLIDHASFLTQKINFLLDATLGMINIQQTGIIKIFSVAAVVFLPPTLIASIYGMNFKFMPELAWPYGYPVCAGADGAVGHRALPVLQVARLALGATRPGIPAAARATGRDLPPSAHGRGP